MIAKSQLISSFVLLFLLFGGFSACNKESVEPGPKPIQLSAEQAELIQDNTHFAFDLLREVSSAAVDGDNVFLSPLSVSLALAMTLNGAEGETLDGMRQAMRLSGLSREEINEAYRKLMKDLLSVDPKVVLNIANSIWYRSDFQVQPPFIDVNKDYYDAEVVSLDFDAPGAVDQINQWVSDKTNELIESIIEEIPAEAVMYLINAIYFKGQWKYEFDKEETMPDSFSLSDGTVVEVPMMRQQASLGYHSHELFTAAELPYGRGNYSMVVLLPNEGKSVDQVIGAMDRQLWEDLTSELDTAVELGVRFPRFKFAFEQKLKPVLSGMGMGLAFMPFQADFSGINPDAELFINEVFHKAFVEVNEEGTEAAAVTAVEVGVTSIGPGGAIPFWVNRPFVFVIKEKFTNAVIFAGKVMVPVEE
ncbi:MAG: serpin family protein [Bacteroidales bacterium]